MRRGFAGWVGGAVSLLVALCVLPVISAGQSVAAPAIVTFHGDYPIGSIVVVNNERRLYYVLGGNRAIRYPVAVGTPDNQWTGQLWVQSKAVNPSWTPPWSPGNTVPGGPGNPLGVRALYLGWTTYRIHGTNAPGSIGRPASHGCIRMLNPDVIHLYERVHIGAPVYVVKTLAPAEEASDDAKAKKKAG